MFGENLRRSKGGVHPLAKQKRFIHPPQQGFTLLCRSVKPIGVFHRSVEKKCILLSLIGVVKKKKPLIEARNTETIAQKTLEILMMA